MKGICPNVLALPQPEAEPIAAPLALPEPIPGISGEVSAKPIGPSPPGKNN